MRDPDAASPSPSLRSAAVQYGVVLREARRVAGWSQERLAEQAGVHATHVSRLERGLVQPSLETVLRLGKALDVPAGKMVGSVAEGWEVEP